MQIYNQPPGTTAFEDAWPLDTLTFVRLRAATRSLERFEGIWPAPRTVTGDGEPESIPAGRVSAGFFGLLDGEPVLGRVFTEAEAASAANVVVLSHGLWRRRFGGDPSVLGRALFIDREPYTIIGVTRAGFEPGFAESEFWTPLDVRKPDPLLGNVQTIGLLQRGLSPAQADAELEGLLPKVAEEAPAVFKGWTMGVIDLRQAQYGARRPAILMLLGAVATLALIAIANLGNLTLADLMYRVTTFQKAARIDPGFDPRNVVTAQLRLSETALETEADRGAFVERILERVRATPGVVAAGTTLNPFLAGQGNARSLAFVEDRPTPDGQPYTVQSRRVTPGYLETMRIPLVRGRDFDAHDRLGAPSVAMVSRGFAQRFWPNEDPIGRRVKRCVATKEWAILVGVVENVRDIGIDQAPTDTIYTPYLQQSLAALPVGLVVRTAGDPSGFVTAMKRAVWDVDPDQPPDQPLDNIVTLDAFLAASLGPQRFRAMLVAVFAALGLLLATIGTYGVTARSVAERTREVGVRIALGGRPRDVWWTIAWGRLRAVLAGAVAGSAAAGLAGAGLTALLPEVQGTRWAFTLGAGGALVTVGALAALVAARAATSVEPLRALRAE